MPSIYDKILKAKVTLSDSGELRTINCLDEYREIDHRRGREAAAAYLCEIASTLSISEQALRNLDQGVSYRDPQPRDSEYRFSQDKPGFDTATAGVASTMSAATRASKSSRPRCSACTA